MEFGGASSGPKIEVSVRCVSKCGIYKNDQTREAKGKLPKEMKKKVEEWKFEGRALVMCMVAYLDGKNVQSFQLVYSILPICFDLMVYVVLRVL